MFYKNDLIQIKALSHLKKELHGQYATIEDYHLGHGVYTVITMQNPKVYALKEDEMILVQGSE